MLACAESNFSNFKFEYLRENKFLRKTILACFSGAQMGLINEKNWVRKSRDTAPLSFPFEQKYKYDTNWPWKLFYFKSFLKKSCFESVWDFGNPSDPDQQQLTGKGIDLNSCIRKSTTNLRFSKLSARIEVGSKIFTNYLLGSIIPKNFFYIYVVICLNKFNNFVQKNLKKRDLKAENLPTIKKFVKL